MRTKAVKWYTDPCSWCSSWFYASIFYSQPSFLFRCVFWVGGWRVLAGVRQPRDKGLQQYLVDAQAAIAREAAGDSPACSSAANAAAAGAAGQPSQSSRMQCNPFLALVHKFLPFLFLFFSSLYPCVSSSFFFFHYLAPHVTLYNFFLSLDSQHSDSAKMISSFFYFLKCFYFIYCGVRCGWRMLFGCCSNGL